MEDKNIEDISALVTRIRDAIRIVQEAKVSLRQAWRDLETHMGPATGYIEACSWDDDTSCTSAFVDLLTAQADAFAVLGEEV